MPAKLFFAACVVLSLIAGTLMMAKAPALQQQNESQGDRFQKEMQDRMFKEANKKRQQDIKNDTEKLFELASELKAAVEKTNENMLSLDVIKKAEQVEKLAKKVKENMREVSGPPQNLPTPVPLPTPFSH